MARSLISAAAAWSLLRRASTSEESLIQEEAAAYAYFQKSTLHGTPQSVSRYRNLSEKQFEDLALSGRPFVVEDGGEGQPFVGWTCDKFKKEYPDGVVKVEYVRGAQTVWPMTSAWQEERHPIPKAEPDGPQYAPWYWGVKGANEPEEAAAIFRGKQNPLPHVQSTMRLPPWMRRTDENTQEVLGSPEFWFSMPRAGAAMHMDSHCESTYAIQLSGTRKWRVGWAPPVPNGTLYKDGTYADGNTYGKKYTPPFEAVVSEGEAFFMPSAFLHETANVGEGCAVSLTFQFRDPIPARYFRQSLRHLRRTQDFFECWGLLGQIASLGAGKLRKGDSPKLAALDRDGDGKFTIADARNRILRAGHAFHDADEDGVVTAEELQKGWNAWVHADAEARQKGTKKVKPKSFDYVVERARSDL